MITRDSYFKAWALLDRDGTIIVDKGYLSDPKGIEFAPGAIQGMQLLREAGFGFVLVTNQSGIARGYFNDDALRRVHRRLVAMLANYGLAFEAIEYCPHGPGDGCECRKPAPGMIYSAMRKLSFGRDRAVMIGDSEVDMDAAAAAGVPGIRIDRCGKFEFATHFLEAAQLAVKMF